MQIRSEENLKEYKYTLDFTGRFHETVYAWSEEEAQEKFDRRIEDIFSCIQDVDEDISDLDISCISEDY